MHAWTTMAPGVQAHLPVDPQSHEFTLQNESAHCQNFQNQPSICNISPRCCCPLPNKPSPSSSAQLISAPTDSFPFKKHSPSSTPISTECLVLQHYTQPQDAMFLVNNLTFGFRLRVECRPVPYGHPTQRPTQHDLPLISQRGLENHQEGTQAKTHFGAFPTPFLQSFLDISNKPCFQSQKSQPVTPHP